IESRCGGEDANVRPARLRGSGMGVFGGTERRQGWTEHHSVGRIRHGWEKGRGRRLYPKDRSHRSERIDLRDSKDRRDTLRTVRISEQIFVLRRNLKPAVRFNIFVIDTSFLSHLSVIPSL